MLRVALLAAAAFVTQARIIAFGVQVNIWKSGLPGLCVPSVDGDLIRNLCQRWERCRLCGPLLQAGASIQSRPSYADFSGTQPRPVTVSQSVQETTDDPYLLYPDQMQLAW